MAGWFKMSATSQTQTLTTIADNCWAVMMCHGMYTAGTGTTLRIAGDNNSNLFDGNGLKTPAGSYSLQTTNGSSTGYGAIMASFKPYVPSAAGNPGAFFQMF